MIHILLKKDAASNSWRFPVCRRSTGAEQYVALIAAPNLAIKEQSGAGVVPLVVAAHLGVPPWREDSTDGETFKCPQNYNSTHKSMRMS
jgi:hypothetical protein